MANNYFKFKQFSVVQDLCAMKVGTDGVLLGAWATVTDTDENILDIGCGTGLIALMLAQRTSKARITGIDIDAGAVLQSSLNFMNSPWYDRLRSVHQPLHLFAIGCEQRYDLIVSNPPFFSNSLKAPDKARNTARHTDTLNSNDLLRIASLLLNETGRICLILPVDEGLQLVQSAANNGLYTKQRIEVFPKPGLKAKRLLLEFVKTPCDCHISEITIESEQRHIYSEEFSLMVKDFYLKL
jgi:tRNA1Val (adenine37-N6)-methyltransferase